MEKNIFTVPFKIGVIITFGFITLIKADGFSQNNSLVINGAYITMNGGSAQDPVFLVVNQDSPLGILRSSGHIVSENQYNIVKWNSASNTGNFVVPFGVGANSNDYVPVVFNKMTNNNSAFQVSTWGTDVQNMPYPGASSVNPVTSMTGTTDAIQNAVDRFWDTSTDNATTANLTFSYLGSENTTAAPTNYVRAQRWDGTAWEAPVNSTSAGVTAGVGTGGPYTGQSSFSPWVLITEACPVDTISYAITSYCTTDNSSYLPIHTNLNVSGSYSASTGLSINTSTGSINPSASTPGTYTVVFTINQASCPSFTTSTTITISPTHNATMNFQKSQYCFNDVNPSPVISGTGGGTFTIDNGGVIDPNTGKVDLAASGVGTYTVEYTTQGDCSVTVTTNISIFNNPPAPVILQNGNTLSVTLQSGQTAQWYLNGNVIGTGASIAITQDGSYTVEVSEAGGCSASATGNYSYLDVPEDALSYDLSVFPNPTENHLNVVLEGNERIKNIVVFDALGKEVFSVSSLNENTHTIDLTHYTKGVYLVRIGLQNEFVHKKVVKK